MPGIICSKRMRPKSRKREPNFQVMKVFSKYGAEFLFGNLVKPEYQNALGFQFAFGILPTIIYFSAVMSILYHLGIMQKVVDVIAGMLIR